MVNLKAPLVPFFQQFNFYFVREKVKTLHTRQTRNSLLSRRNGKAQPANMKKWREKQGHVVTLAVHI